MKSIAPVLFTAIVLVCLSLQQARANDDAVGPRYGDQGQAELSLMLAAGADALGAGAGARYFVVDGVAPGIETDIYRVSGRTLADVFGTLRLVPVRLSSFALALTGRAGRIFISDHDSGWGLGGGISALFMSGNIGLEVGIELLHMLPESFCADLAECTLTRPVVGVRIVF